MDEYDNDTDYTRDEIEIIELDDEVEDGIIEYDENEDGIVPSFSMLDEIEDTESTTEITDLAKQTFTRHSKSVFQGILNAAGTIAVTGGEDEIAYVWSTETCEVILECSGHKDSVTQLAFNFDEQLLVSGDMSGLIQVWDLKDKKLVWCYEGDDLEWLLWHPKANVLFAGCEFGNVFLWQIPQGTCKVLPTRGSTSTCGQILSDGVRLLTGYSDGQVRLWDIKTASVIWELQQDVIIKGVNSLDIMKDDSLFILAPSAQVFKISDGSLITTLLGKDEADVEAVAFGSESSNLLATGSISGDACIWDTKLNSVRYEAKIGAAVTTMKWGPNDMLLIGCTDAHIYVVEGKTGDLIQTLTGHKLDILSLYLSKNGNVILSTSDDCTGKIFTA